jgi:DNA-binding transcriptional LysR family regulator
MTDRFEDIRTFITVAQANSFAGAGERLGLAKSAVSRRISDLEDRLGTRLLHRTTREVRLTESGADFYDRGIKLLADLEEAEDFASNEGSDPVGKLRVTAPVSFGIHCMSAVLAEVSARYPRLSVQMEFLDRHADLVREGFDVAVRISRMKDSSLIARKLAQIRHAVCGSPDYFRKHGKPKVPADLRHHKALLYSYADPRHPWQLGGSDPVLVPSDFSCNNGDVLREMAVAGCGLVFLPTFIIYQAVDEGLLETCLTEYTREAIGLYAVYPSTRNLPAKVRVFIDLLIERFSDDPVWDRTIFQNSDQVRSVTHERSPRPWSSPRSGRRL